jgi:hypothetical protein
MSNAVYPKFKAASINGGSNTNLSGGNVKALLINGASYSYSAAHEFLSDIPSGARVANSPNLTGKTISTSADFDSDDVIFSTVTGDTVEAVILVVDTGTEATSRLVAFFDSGITGAPLSPDGTNVRITVPTGGWFRL